VKEGQFREDLFHRLNVIRIHMPPLRERREDIPLLARHFLASAAQELSVDPKQLDSDVERYLSRLEWPGNVRQLENTCRWLTVMSPGQRVHMDELPPELQQEGASTQTGGSWEEGLRQWADLRLASGENDLLADAVPRFERIMIDIALQHSGGRRQDAAKLLGWGRNTLTRKIKELGI
ncbi:MAG: nitrogen regulation protein NR(I), partial [Gammaproteobacteria bacterium]|nr:nitrogen regulation protein NR(I) [Gammaproteobacteria bacterium]